MNMINKTSGESKLKSMTLGKVCEIIQLQIPAFWDANTPITGVYGYPEYCKSNTVAILATEDIALHCRQCLAKGTTAVIVPMNIKNSLFESENRVLGTSDVANCITLYENYVRNLFNCKIVTVTGSVGKTTTVEMLKCVLDDAFKLHSHHSLSNSRAAVLRVIQGLHDDDEVYLQEVGGSRPGYVETSAKGLLPDIAVITNIGEAHLDLYGSLDNILKDKASLVENLRAGGIGVFDYDNEYLRDYKTDKEIVWYSLNNKSVDYYSENIKSNPDNTQSFDIVCAKNNMRYSVTINILGEHNVKNALSAFAVGCFLGIEPNTIIKSLEKYHPQGTRQNLCNIGGYNLFLDMFNAAPHSLIGSIKVLESIALKPNGRRIVVFGDIAHLGNHSENIHKDLGEKIAQCKIDILYCFGEQTRFTYEEALKHGMKQVFYSNNREELNSWIHDNVTTADVTLYKGGQAVALAKTVDTLYGTTYYHGNELIPVSTHNIAVQYRKIGDYTEFSKLLSTDAEMVYIQDSFDDIPVRRIAANALSRSKNLKKIHMPDSILNIGNGAFYICPKLEEIKLSKNLKMLENNAFNYCPSLKNIVLPEGLLHIGNRAFYDCRQLERVVIPPSVGFIGKEAFTNCNQVVIVGKAGSYAEAYASKEHIPFCESDKITPIIAEKKVTTEAEVAPRAGIYSWKKRFTIQKICQIANIEVPELFKDIAKQEIPMITCSAGQVQKDGVFFERGLWENGQKATKAYIEKTARRAYNNGAKIIVSSAQYYKENGEPLPCLIVDDPIALFSKLCKIIRNAFSDKTITTTITGSVGKTTTKEMLALVASERFKTLYSRENANGFASIANYMQQISPDIDIYIQEAGAFYPDLVESEARILEPNACVITNIGTPHIDLYGSVENILHDKLGLLRNMKPNGMAFLNLDDPMLSKVNMDCNITWFSIDNPNADYYTQNIVFGDGFMEFDIVGKCKPAHIKLHTYGIHNIINAVAAFAYGHWLGISETLLAQALAKYKAVGMRQNLCNIGGYHLYIDCYNSAPNSVVGSIETLLRIPVAEGNRRIVVLGDIPRMGDKAPQVHTECGQKIAPYNIDLYICFGPNMLFMAEELKKAGRNVLYTCNREQMNLWIARESRIGDLILFKAGHPSHLAKTIDQIFGTSLHITDGDVIVESGRNFQTERFSGKIIDNMAEIRKCHSKEATITIPSKIDNSPVYRIGSDAFTKMNSLRELVISDGIVNIGVAAFYICTRLKKITLPSSLKIIERSAFNYCTALEEIVIPDSVINIERRAFYDCHSLKKITIGINTVNIGAEAFAKCPNVVIYGVKGSYAEKYALNECIPFKEL